MVAMALDRQRSTGNVQLAGRLLCSRLRRAALAVLLLIPWGVGAQPQDAANGATNLAAGAEEMVSALGTLESNEPVPGEEGAGTNVFPFASQTNAAGAVSPADSQSYRRPSGRESRSRWSNRQRSNQFGGNLSASSSQTGAEATNGPVSLDYSAFRVVAERSIFDPNRTPAYVPGARSREPVYFGLVGTMTYEAGTFAFFSGSSSEYQKTLQCSGVLAGYKVTAINPDAVKLARGTNELELRVGMQLRLGEDGSWSLAQGLASETTTNLETAYSAAAGATSANAAPSGSDSEILKRLMERRAKE